MVTSNTVYPLFAVTGIEIEYMIVNSESLEIQPIADQLIEAIAGEIINDVDFDDEMGISNELALHVIELKTIAPRPSLTTLPHALHKHVVAMNNILEPWQCTLMPTGAHPWLVPKNIKLWPHGHREIYNTYDRIFNCSGHGWSNLQSTHINLPFANDQEFHQLHAAIRLILPLIPALTASSPFIESKNNALDSRLLFYGGNQSKFPSISGNIIPEAVGSIAEYHDTILAPMYQAIAPEDPAGILQEEWLNSRGAIARFERSAMEIKIMDAQESPLMDIACVAGIKAILQYIIDNSDEYLLQPMGTQALKTIYDATIRQGLDYQVTNPVFLSQLNLATAKNKSCNYLWDKLLEKAASYIDQPQQIALHDIIVHGNLASRILKMAAGSVTKTQLHTIYTKLCDALRHNQMF